MTERFEYSIYNYTELNPDQIIAVWHGRNNPDVRSYMSNKDLIPYDVHIKFIQSLLNREDKKYYAIFKDADFVGCYEYYDIIGKTAERGLYIMPEYRGRGVAARIERYFDAQISFAGGAYKSKGIPC